MFLGLGFGFRVLGFRVLGEMVLRVSTEAWELLISF